MVIDVVVEDGDHNTATLDDAIEWQSTYNLAFEVVVDSEGEWVPLWGNVEDTDLFNQHSYTVLGSDGRVSWRADGFTLERVDDIIEAAESAE